MGQMIVDEELASEYGGLLVREVRQSASKSLALKGKKLSWGWTTISSSSGSDLNGDMVHLQSSPYLPTWVHRYGSLSVRQD